MVVQIGQISAPRPVIRVRDIVARLRTLTRNLTNLAHSAHSDSWKGGVYIKSVAEIKGFKLEIYKAGIVARAQN